MFLEEVAVMQKKTAQSGIKIAVISILLLGLILSAVVLSQTPGGAAVKPIVDNLFQAEDFDSVMMFGNPKLWDDEKNLSVDLNNDGVSEEFIISKDFSDNVILEGIQRDAQGETLKSINFWTGEISVLLPEASKEGDSIAEGYFLQISCCDVDEDGFKEVLISAGDRTTINVTAVYEYSPAGETPFTYCGNIRCDTVVKYIGDGTIYAYRGKLADNHYDTYVYNGNELRKK
jgi:hypothetical protein